MAGSTIEDMVYTEVNVVTSNSHVKDHQFDER